MERFVASIIDVARQAGVSPATVSRVMQGKVFVAPETRDRVLAAIEAIGYRPSSLGRALRVGHADSVALLVGDIEQGWYAALAKRLQVALARQGLDMLLFNLEHSASRLEHMLQRSNAVHVRAIVLASSDPFDFHSLRPELERLQRRDIRLFTTGQDLTALGITSVLHDDDRAGREAITHLVAQGRRRIAYLNRLAGSVAGQRRYQGYRAGLAEHGLPLDERLVWGNPRFRFDGGYHEVQTALARGDQFDAILAGTDELAVGAMAALADHKLRVPQDIAVIGFGNLELCQYVRPRLTTLSGEDEAISQSIVAHLGSTGTRLVTHPRRLILRESA